MVKIDHHRAPIVRKMFEKVAYENWSGRRVHKWLKDELKFKTKNGKHLALGNIYLTLRHHFYYGTFEYPKGGGQWYQGKHEPIITKELFDKAQENISEHVMKDYGKEYAFTKLMTCALCGSGITACEKYKYQQNGNVHKYIYYGCSRSKDKSCKAKYIEEKDLIQQFSNLMDKIDLDEIGMKEKIKVEIERHKKFQSGLLGQKVDKIKADDIDIRNYAKYLLREGSMWEKRELLYCLKSRIQLGEKKISII